MVMMVVVVVVVVVADDDADGGDADGDDVADRHMVASMQRLWTPRRLVKHASCGVQIVGLSFVRRLCRAWPLLLAWLFDQAELLAHAFGHSLNGFPLVVEEKPVISLKDRQAAKVDAGGIFEEALMERLKLLSERHCADDDSVSSILPPNKILTPFDAQLRPRAALRWIDSRTATSAETVHCLRLRAQARPG